MGYGWRIAELVIATVRKSSSSTFGYHSLVVVQLDFTTPPWPALKGYASSESADARIVHSEPDIPIGCAERDLDMRIITLKVGAPVVEEAPPGPAKPASGADPCAGDPCAYNERLLRSPAAMLKFSVCAQSCGQRIRIDPASTL